jgi:hypothetical protein
MAAGAAKVVRALQFAAIGAFLKGFDLQAVVAATHAALRGRRFSLGNGHDLSCILNSVSRIGYPDLSVPSPETTGPPAKPKAVPAQMTQENLLPEGASTPDGVGCRIGRGYSVFARKGKPRGTMRIALADCPVQCDIIGPLHDRDGSQFGGRI